MKRTMQLSTTLLVVAVAFFSFAFGFLMTDLLNTGTASATFDEDTVIHYKLSDTEETAAAKAPASQRLFADLSTNDWFYDGANYCLNTGLIAGYSDGNFYPEARISRAMMVLTLWNISDYPFVNHELPFTDVAEGQWYTDAIRWASSAGIINGYGDATFRPDNALTREDLVTVMWRYQKNRGLIADDYQNESMSFADADEIDAYALSAMQWANSTGVLIGTSDSRLSPDAPVSRAQFSVFLSRFAPHTGFVKSSALLEHRLVAIKIEKAPLKKEYSPGEKFDPAGMVVVGYFADGTTEILDDYDVVPAKDPNGKPTFTVSYDGVVAEIPETKIEEKRDYSGDSEGGRGRTLTRVSVTTPPAKTSYASGEQFDPTGMVVTAYYSDGSSGVIAGYTVTPTAMVDGVSSVTVSYGGYGDQVAVTVARALQSIAVTTPPIKTVYNHGDAFDAAGMVVTASYTDGSSEDITTYSISPAILDYTNTCVTVTNEGKSCTIPVTVNRVLTGVSVTTPPDTLVYSENSAFDATGMVVTATYTDGGSEAVTGYTVSPDPLPYGTTSVTVSYGGYSDNVAVTVIHVLKSIAITTPPAKTTYNHNDAFDPTGMVVTITYLNDDEETVTGYTVTPDPVTYGTTSVTVSYGGKSATTPVTVNRVLDSITVTTPPAKTTYNHNDAFDATGMVVTATYTDGGSEAVTDYSVSPDPVTYGTTSVTVSYGGKTATTPVAVNRVLASIAVTTAPTKTSYDVGEIFDATGMVVTATYTDGGSEAVTGYSVTPSGTLTLGTTSVTVSYGGKTAMTGISVARIALTAVPSQSGTLTYNGSPQSPTWSNYDSTKMAVTGSQSETDANTYSVTFTPGANYKWPDESTEGKVVNWTIGAKSLTIAANAQTIDFGGNIDTATSQVAATGLADGDALDSVTLTPSTANATTTGTITPSAAVIKRGGANVTSNYNVTYTNGALTINKVAAIVAAAPTGKTLIYTGGAQELVNAGTASGGTMQYKVDDGAWGEAIPTAVDANVSGYTVYYKVVGDDNHTDDAGGSVNVSIAKASFTATVSISGYTYAGTKSTPSVSSNPGNGSVTYYGRATASGTATAWSGITNTTFDAGTRYCYAEIAETANYNGYTTENASFAIAKASPATPTSSKASLTLNSSKTSDTFTVTRSGDGAITATSSDPTVATTGVNGTTVTVTSTGKTGSATITITVAAGTNHNAYSGTGCQVGVTASFAPAWTASANGTVVTLGTFRTGSATGSIIAPASRPYSSSYNGGYSGATISGTGNLTQYDPSKTYVFGNSDATASNNLKWIKLSDTLLVADRNLLCNISWQNIYKNYTPNTYNESYNTVTTRTSIIGATSGTTVTIDGHTYRVRLLTGGTSSPGTGSEWNTLTSLTTSDDVMHWQYCYSWCSETSAGGNANDRPLRGYGSAANWLNGTAAHPGVGCGFRPALELVS